MGRGGGPGGTYYHIKNCWKLGAPPLGAADSHGSAATSCTSSLRSRRHRPIPGSVPHVPTPAACPLLPQRAPWHSKCVQETAPRLPGFVGKCLLTSGHRNRVHFDAKDCVWLMGREKHVHE